MATGIQTKALPDGAESWVERAGLQGSKKEQIRQIAQSQKQTQMKH